MRKSLSVILFAVIIFLMIPAFSALAADYPPSQATGAKVDPVIVSYNNYLGQTGAGLFDGTTINDWITNQVFYFYQTDYVEIELPVTVNLWRYGTTTWAADYNTLKILKKEGSTYTDVTSIYSVPTSAITQNQSQKFAQHLPPGVYKFQAPGNGMYRMDSEWYAEQDDTQPQVPTGLLATADDSQVNLVWNPIPGVTSYSVKRSTTSNGPYSVIASGVTTATYTDISAVNGTSYYYVISAMITGAESANSTQSSATPQAVLPTAPILAGQSGIGQNTLTWNTAAGATSYQVKRSTTAGGPYSVLSASVTLTTYADPNIVNGTTYYYVVSASNAGGTSGNSNEVSITSQALEPTLNVVIAQEKISVGQEFIADIVLKNVANIYAEDFTVKYDNTRFDYLGFETVTGHQIYNQPTDQNGSLRFIVASQGANYGITGEKVFVKLKLRAKAVGTGKVDALKCRIADTNSEFDLGALACGEDTVTVENQDVNRSGEYTLLDLAIDGYYYGQLASSANPTVYTADQAGDEYVSNDDLVFIVNQMLLNTNYAPNF
ncbi:cohesin domain-containing protein [Paenibacillus sp. WQ 127069]|uniref:Cohesin domain-containing protein n=1 Tax=Paenibacillus baimaensis TaxID=2982185 RepID=A0ABT2UB14_9BACL|nr:cohesin domain-containing protein [Paenibacillus sp. WQ 127069]MCU6790854.1 cohesin domain-containing protein [Paenibacillus sp. WQ 127069]